MPQEKLIGEVCGYYDDKHIAYLELFDELATGQILHFKDPDGDF